MTTGEEWAKAERQRMPRVSVVYRDYEIANGLLRPVDIHLVPRDYMPGAAATIVRDLAQVTPGSEADALAFARH